MLGFFNKTSPVIPKESNVTEKLPDEILALIFGFLEVTDHPNTIKVCSHWHKIHEDYEKEFEPLWKFKYNELVDIEPGTVVETWKNKCFQLHQHVAKNPLATFYNLTSSSSESGKYTEQELFNKDTGSLRMFRTSVVFIIMSGICGGWTAYQTLKFISNPTLFSTVILPLSALMSKPVDELCLSLIKYSLGLGVLGGLILNVYQFKKALVGYNLEAQPEDTLQPG